jgi:ferredoxin-nitrite reductase
VKIMALTSQNTKQHYLFRVLRRTEQLSVISVSARPDGSESIFCPGLFVPSIAQDGMLARIRVPGGIVSSQQALVLAEFAAKLGAVDLQVTNRSNIQLLLKSLDPKYLDQADFAALQAVGLAAPIASVDRFRNIMASPTAGIDTKMLVDTRPLVKSIDSYISSSPYLTGLSAKFSVGIDGGEALSIGQRPNDLLLLARPSGLRLMLRMSDGSPGGDASRTTVSPTGLMLDTRLVWGLEQVVEVFATLSDLYLQHSGSITPAPSEHRRSSKPRFRHLVEHWGLDWLRVNCPGAELTREVVEIPQVGYQYLGVHSQLQSEYFYLGVVLPLGRLTIDQLRGLAEIAAVHGNSEIRLTPWQNIILPNLSAIQPVIVALDRLGLSVNPKHSAGSIAACRGTMGCAAAVIDSQNHALAAIRQLTLTSPVQIHISGCDKGCAQPVPSDIALKGTSQGYEIYLHATGTIFGRYLYPAMPADRALKTVQRMLQVHQALCPTTSFRDFTDRHDLSTLLQFFHA